MRRGSDDDLSGPEIAASLEAIEAAIAGEPVDPVHAEVAEVALLVAAQRPAPAPEFAAELDRRVESRFAAPSRDATPAAPRRSPTRWLWALIPAAGLAGVALIAVIGSSSGGSSATSSEKLSSRPALHAARSTSAPAHPGASTPTFGARSGASSSQAPASPGLQLPATGRKLTQSSHLSLGAQSNRIDAVAQEAYNVVGTQNGFVDSSTVTAAGGSGGYARMQLTVPSATLPQTMTDLSQLRYATVLSRTDKVEDVTGELARAKHRHQKTRVRALERGVIYSQIALTIQTDAPVPAHKHHSHGGGFTIGRAAGIALKVLTAIGGILLIALAVLVPAALLGLAAGRTAGAVRHRRRERALDIA